MIFNNTICNKIDKKNIENKHIVLYNINRGEIVQQKTPLLWEMCPKCGSKLLVIQENTVVKNLPCKCKHCKKISLITLAPIRAEK